MEFNKLSIRGFKSFPEQTKFKFEPGVTAIVGPNGCGKSNVSEAIRWVLGEQNVYNLRGRKTEDLIFNGSENRKPLGMAEVSLSITHTPDSNQLSPRSSNKITNLPFSEVVVTRRIFRSGESEYFINKIPCRLRDINELFMDTGMGVNTYSMIAQDQVERILISKPEERRSILEEAAGIMKYNTRKNEAIRKLELVKENLVRVGDIISELSRQMDFLKRQAAKAKRYQKYNERLKELEIDRNYHLYWQSKEKREERDGKINELENFGKNLVKQIENGKNELEKLKKELEELEEILEKQREEELHSSTEIEKSNSNILLGEERRKNLQAKKLQLEKRKGELGQTHSSSSQKERRLREQLAEAENCLRESEEHLKQNQGEITHLREEEKKYNQQIEKQNSSLFQAVGERSNHKNSLERVRIKLHNVGVDIRKLEKENSDLEKEQKDLEERLNSKLSQEEERKKEREILAEEAGKVKRKVEKLNQEVNSLEEKNNLLAKEYQERSLHLETIKEMEERREGYNRATKYLLKEEESNIYGLITDILQVPANLRKAVEVALRENLQSIVVQNEEIALQLVKTLRQKGLGRATFLAFDNLKLKKIKSNRPSNLLIDKLKFPAQYHNIFTYLLGKVVIAKDLEEARKLSSSLSSGKGWIVATLSGELLSPEGVLYGGSWKEREVLTGRKDRVSYLQEKVSLLEKKLEKIGSLRRKNLRSLQKLEKQSEQKETELGEKIRETEELKQSNLRDLGRKDELIRRKETIAQERERLQAEKKDAEKEVKQTEVQLVQVEEKIKQHQSAVESFKSSLASLSEEREKLNREGTEDRTKTTSLKESLTRYSGNLSEIEKEYQRNEGERISIQEELSETKNGIEKLGKEILEEKGKLKEFQSKRTASRENLEEHREKRRKLDQVIKEEEKTIIIKDQELGKKKDELQTLKIEEATLTTQLNNLKETVYHSYEVDLERLTQEDRKTSGTGGEGNNLESEIEDLQNKIRNIGNVNLAAIEEEEELSERYNFYAEQQKDLLESENSLQKSIREINHTTRELLKTTFQQVRVAFNQVFQDLFRGGEGDLSLIDSSDILEAGLDIVVRPPGKKTQSINLLSGGEKALTAIALLFALFKVKPSPFCVLDEVDAPLDEPNIERFTTYLRSLVKDTQFVIISHNKKTLSIADVLYGVTMGEPGVSKLISVKFAQEKNPATRHSLPST